MYALRQQAARNAGFANFRDYVFPAKFRFDYTPADCERFHEAVERTAAPAVERMLEGGARRLGLDALRPWDLAVDPYRAARSARSPRWKNSSPARDVFDRVDPALGHEFQTMIDERLLDLDSRKGKAPGGYCETLHFRGRPFIFMNAVGLVDDVMTLLHEAGHAFHAFASHPQPLIWQRHPGSEAAELASMSMELLAGPHLVRPVGYFTPEDHRSAWLEHLEDVLLSLVHIASVDAFQTWIYTSGEGRDATPATPPGSGSGAASSGGWTGADWSGSGSPDGIASSTSSCTRSTTSSTASPSSARFRSGATACAGPRQAVARYREALALGAVRPLPEMYRAAGAELTFDRRAIGELVA